MSYANILVALGPDAGSRARLSLAADLARRMSAYLIGTAASPMPLELTGASMIASAILDTEQHELERYFDDLEERFHAAADTPRREWRDGIHDPLAFLTRQARIADLIVASARADEFSPDPADLVADAGRPILLPKPKAAKLELSAIVVGWKAGAPANRALAGSLPLLKLAGRVFVAGVGEEIDPEALEDVAEGLRRHRVRAEAAWQGRGGRSVAKVLLDFCDEAGADLLVTGAYSRSRSEEWAFGGVTRDLLHTDRVSRLLVR